MTSYAEFLAAREQLADSGGFEPVDLPGHLFDYQRHLVEWAVRQGRGGIFADCGLGKTPMSLAWAGCTEVVTLPGWENSRGARLEVSIAEVIGMAVTPLATYLEQES